MDDYYQNEPPTQGQERVPSQGFRLTGFDRGKLTALRLRALVTITSALEAELLSMESDVLGSERALEKDIRIDFYEAVDSFQKNLLLATLTLERGSQTRAARRLSLRPSTLNTMLKRYGIDPKMCKVVSPFETPDTSQ
jgi:transcriptional regulator with GAF, ATPase, and Fis domain